MTMPEPTLDPRHTALVFFDTLKTYLYENGKLRPESADQVRAFQRLNEAARAHGMPVFYAAADHRSDGADWSTAITDNNAGRFVEIMGKQRLKPATVRGHTGAEVIDEIAPQPGDYTIKKHRWNAFQGTNLDLSLRTAGMDTIILAGSATEVGIASTAYGGRDRDFSVVVVSDACRGSSPELDKYFMEHVFPRLGRVRTVDETVALLQAGAKGQKTL
jgi:nicotinamidase-related amidase